MDTLKNYKLEGIISFDIQEKKIIENERNLR